MREAWVYMMTNRPNGILYLGVTACLRHRIWQHREGLGRERIKRPLRVRRAPFLLVLEWPCAPRAVIFNVQSNGSRFEQLAQPHPLGGDVTVGGGPDDLTSAATPDPTVTLPSCPKT
jgi:hypothetical protein